MMGSPFYMSPEQMASSRDVDARTDMWALAVTLYELLTGTTPFRGNSLPELCVQVTQEPPLAIRELRPEIPEGLENIILRCLEKKANDRYANFAELATALAPFGSSQAQGLAERIARTLRAAGIADIDVEPPPDSEVRKPVVAEGTSAHTHTQATWQTTGRGASAKRLLPLTAVATVGLAILIVVGRWLWAGDDPAGADSAASVSPPPSAETPAEDSVRAAATGQDGTPATEGGVAPEASAARAEPAAPIVAPAALSAEPSAVPAEEPTQTPVKAPHPPRSATGRPTSGKTEAATKPPPPGSEGDVYDYRK